MTPTVSSSDRRASAKSSSEGSSETAQRARDSARLSAAPDGGALAAAVGTDQRLPHPLGRHRQAGQGAPPRPPPPLGPPPPPPPPPPAAAAIAFATAPATPITGASPTPFAPYGPSGVGTSTISVSIAGTTPEV